MGAPVMRKDLDKTRCSDAEPESPTAPSVEGYVLVDLTTRHRGKGSEYLTGYLTLLFDGKRVCDFFPFSAQAPEAFVREQARIITDTMNRATPAPQTEPAELREQSNTDPSPNTSAGETV